MQFKREPQYFNRYTRSSGYQEWRALAGEVPQSAEFNEIQSLMQDRVKQASEIIFQNGDVVSGLQLDPQNSFSFYRTSSSTGSAGKVWIDGTAHSVPSASYIEPHATSWGFIGVFLDRSVIDYSGDEKLRDPAVQDMSGKYLGLPGANRLKIKPVWVSGSLAVSRFEELSIGFTSAILKNTTSFIEKPSIVDYKEKVTDKSVYNAKFILEKLNPASAAGDTNEVNVIYKDKNFISGDKREIGLRVRASLKVKIPADQQLPTSDIKVFLNIFSAYGSQSVISSTEQVIAFSDFAQSRAVTKNIELVLDMDKLNQLTKTDIYYAGVTVKTSETNQFFPLNTEIYVSDIYTSLTSEDTRRPMFKTFTLPDGSQYSNFIPGPDESIKLAKADDEDSPQSLSGYVLSALTLNGIAGSLRSELLNPVIRKSVLSETENNSFLSSYGVSKEEAFIRIYPIHITKDKKIVSSLEHREFTNLSDNYFTDRVRKVISTKPIGKYSVEKVDSDTVRLRVPEAFVDGKYLTNREEDITLPVTSLTSKQFVKFDIESFTDYLDPGFSFLVADTDKFYVDCFFKETVTRNQPTTGVYDDLSNSQKDILSVFFSSSNSSIKSIINNVDILTVTYLKNGNLTTCSQAKSLNDSSAAYFNIGSTTQHLDSNVTYSSPVIRWTNNNGADAPDVGSQYNVFYKVRIEIDKNVLDLSPASSPHTKFKLKLDNVSNNDFVSEAKTLTISNRGTYIWKSSNTTTKPVIIHSINPFKVGSVSFYSTFEGSLTKTEQSNSYIIYLAGDYKLNGPDGYFDYKAISKASLPYEQILLLRQNKLPIAFVNISSGQLEDPKVIDYALDPQTEADLGIVLNNLKDELPTLLSQNILVSDSPRNISYLKLGLDGLFSAENQVVSSLSWKIDEKRFPTLANYEVEVVYDYYDGILPLPSSDLYKNLGNTPPNNPVYVNSNLDSPHGAKFYGLLRSFTVSVKDSSAAKTLVSKFLAVINYDKGTGGYEDTDDCPVIATVEVHDIALSS
jgi:hypothetical protein